MNERTTERMAGKDEPRALSGQARLRQSDARCSPSTILSAAIAGHTRQPPHLNIPLRPLHLTSTHEQRTQPRSHAQQNHPPLTPTKMIETCQRFSENERNTKTSITHRRNEIGSASIWRRTTKGKGKGSSTPGVLILHSILTHWRWGLLYKDRKVDGKRTILPQTRSEIDCSVLRHRHTSGGFFFPCGYLRTSYSFLVDSSHPPSSGETGN